MFRRFFNHSGTFSCLPRSDNWYFLGMNGGNTGVVILLVSKIHVTKITVFRTEVHKDNIYRE